MLPENFEDFADQIVAEAENITGFLSESEIRFLALLGACPTSDGSVLEIGSFKGRSTVILARSALLAGDSRIYAVDPMNAPSETDPDLGGDDSSLPDFVHNISIAGLSDSVVHYQEASSTLAERWDQPIRLLWIDGDHTYEGTYSDLKAFEDHLSDRAIVAFHDVLHEFEGGVRVFGEEVLSSSLYGAFGFVGSIGWAQVNRDTSGTETYAKLKRTYAKKLRRLVPYASMEELNKVNKIRYKIWRALVPHGPADPSEWAGLHGLRKQHEEE